MSFVEKIAEKVFERLLKAFASPRALAKSGKFPNSASVLRDIVAGGMPSQSVARRYARLCQVTGVTSLWWILCMFLIAAVLSLVLLDFGWPDDSKQIIFGMNAKQLLSATAAVAIVAIVIYSGLLMRCEVMASECKRRAAASNAVAALLARKPVGTATRAFVGVSLDGKMFTREWIAGMLEYVLARHDELMFLVADDLFGYTRIARMQSHGVELDIPSVVAATTQRRNEFETFLQNEVAKLPRELQDRVSIRRWSEFADEQFARIWRRLKVARHVVDAFGQSLRRDANGHVSKSERAKAAPAALEVSIEFILEEIAMCLRVSELAGFHYEYYPARELAVVKELYDDAFAASRFTVASLIEQPPLRHFTALEELDGGPAPLIGVPVNAEPLEHGHAGAPPELS